MFLDLKEPYIMFAWLALAIVLLLIEIATVGLTCIWPAIGAAVAMILDILHLPLGVQIAAFFVVSILLLFFTRPIAVRMLNSKTERTNYESLIGKVIRIEETVNNIEQTGLTYVDGKEWTVRSASNKKVYEKGEFVQIVKVDGVKLIVQESISFANNQ